jgi:Flp pilus assembly protein TadG
MPIGLHRFSGRLGRDRRGAAAVEFAFIAPAMVAVMFGAYDFGNAAQQQIQLQQAVRAGGAYAISRPTDKTGIQNAVNAALPSGWTLTNDNGKANVTCSWIDPVASTGTLNALPSCNPADLANAPANSGKVIQISATMAYTPLFSWPFSLPSSTAAYVVRFQ